MTHSQSTDELVKRLEDACCCEPDQGFEPCGACKDLAVIERLQRELAARDKTIEALEVDVRWIHQKLKRGEATQDHGLKGNLLCIIDHLADDRPLG